MILATGFFVDAIMGFNVHTLRVFAKVRHIVAIDLVTIVLALGMCVTLIPRWGALGAAVAICTSTVVQKVMFQAIMRATTGVGTLRWPYARFYLGTAALVLALVLVEWVWGPPLVVGLGIAAAAYMLLLRGNRSLLDAHETFPEMSRVPLLGRLLAVPDKAKLASIGEGGP
jgi:O-antigen/teichoic acid export membrane protein